VNDPRLWIPDGTCYPFNLETATQLPLLMRFRVPSRVFAVIRSFTWLITPQSSTQKDGLAIGIFRAKLPSAPATLLDRGISLTGSLEAVEEMGGDSANHPGLVQNATRPVCILLLPGPYEVRLIGASGQVSYVSLSGWTWPEFPQ
jgi:hypothetical protein